MTEIIKYDPEFIFKLKNEYELTEEYNKIYENIMDIMKSSTDGKKFKTNISKEINLKCNKWCRKRFMSDNEKSKKKINSFLNMYSKLNFEEVSINLLKLEITTEDIIDFFVESIVYKYQIYYQSNEWNYLIEKIIFSNVEKWKINNKYMVERLLDNCNKKFNEIIDNDYQKLLEKYFEEDVDEYYKLKNKNYGLMKLLGQLFKHNLIDKSIVTIILEQLTLDVNLNYKLELGIIFIKEIINYISSNEKNKFIDYLKYFLSENKLNKKVKFMIYDFLDISKKSSNDELESNENNYITDDKLEALLSGNIKEYLQNRDIKEFLYNIKKIKILPKSNKIIYYWIIYILENNDNYNDIIFLLSKCLQKRIIKYNMLKYGIIEFLDDYDDFKWDYPKINEIIKKILIDCKKYRFLNNDNIKFIFSKNNINLHDIIMK